MPSEKQQKRQTFEPHLIHATKPMNYISWNNSIAEQFFSPEKAGQRVHLYVTRDQITLLGHPHGDSLAGFIQAVKTGPPWAVKQGLCNCALEAIRGWRSRNLVYPPYIAYLALFIAAASLDGDFYSTAYYPRLRTLLGEGNSTGTYPSFDRMLWLWDDLERWSNVDKAGEWGIFRHHIYGGWIHVGVPTAQTLLSEEDRHALPELFAQAGLDPSSPPTETGLAMALVRYGSGRLRHRTLQRLRAASKNQVEAEARQALLELLLSELREWDGATAVQVSQTTVGIIGEETVGALAYSGTLRLCCSLDRIAGQVRFTLRCKTPGEFPEDGFLLTPAGQDVNEEGGFAFEEWSNGWSVPLERREDGHALDASTLDWRVGWVLEDQAQGWIFRLRPALLHLLVDGRSENLSGYIEVFRLPSNAPFFLLAHPEVAGEMAVWGENSCDGWQEIPLSHGLPVGWKMFVAQRARDDAMVRGQFPILSLPSNVSLLLRGGIRVGKGNRFFHFAPPVVEVQGAGAIEVLCNGQPLGPNAHGLYELPPNMAQHEDDKIEIAARCNGQPAGRSVFYLAREGWDWTGLPSYRWFDASGRPLRDEVSGVAGALVNVDDLPGFDFNGVVPLLEDGAVHYIGRQPGQIVHWPQDPRPSTWDPVWVITSRRRGQAVFCGGEIAAATPVNAKCSDRKTLKKWRQFLWVRRMDISPPSHPELKKLWAKYQEMARDA